MRSYRGHTGSVLILLTILTLAPITRAYPPDPDNAALLYYQAFISLPKERHTVSDLSFGTDPNDQMQEYIKQCQSAVKFAVAASKLKTCDWGLLYSEGNQMSMAYLAQCRAMSFVLRADAVSLVAEGQYRQALEQCLVMRRMAQHVGDENLISLLVNIAINALADKAIQDALGAIPVDKQLLVWLKQQLASTTGKGPAFSNALHTEEECILTKLTEQEKEDLVKAVTESPGERPSPDWIDQIKKADASFFAGSRKYFENHIKAIRTILDSPITPVDKIAQLDDLDKRPAQDAQKDPHAILTASFMAPMKKILILETRSKANHRILEVAIDVYLVTARTGSVPIKLPAGMSKDPFTNQDFTYQKTEDGFTLTRWRDDPGDKTYQHHFKIKSIKRS